MHHEYAVEPRAIGASWETFRYLIEQFGFDKGRLISQFPKHWFRDVYEAAPALKPMQKKRMEEALNQAKKSKVVRYGRPYDPNAGDWLANALLEHQRAPFRAIIAAHNPTANQVILIADDVDEAQPLMTVPTNCAIPRDAVSLAEAMTGMLRFSSRILFIDPFYRPFNENYKRTLRECLNRVKSLNPSTSCEIHYRYHDGNPAPVDLEREAANLFPGVIPVGMKVTIFCWREKDGGADFHARYLITDKGGIAVDAGFSAEGNHQTTDMHLMTFAFSQEKLRTFARTALDYELVGPIIRVTGDGKVERV